LNTVKSNAIAVKKDDFLPFEIENIHLAGEHNRHDVLYAYTAASKFGVTAENAKKAIDDFEGIEHRMENIGIYNSITFYNDCIATIPHAVMCAINAIKANTLIIGGKDRGIDYTDFAVDLENSNLTTIIGTKTTGHKIIDMMVANGTRKNLIKAENLEEAVKFAYENTKRDGVCILSPAASSYNEYKNFEEKGRHYKELVKKYGE
jgi:UDP-N-acetylmuramoylalanine--D-glutamate ligase